MSIRKIGEKLKNNIALTPQENEEFLSFRKLHKEIIDLLDIELQKIPFPPHFLKASRIKRVESIILKLKRPENPKLNSIHDIAGTRIILDNIEELKKIVSLIDETIFNNFEIKHERDKYDYIKTPKKNGYRSVHKIFQYTHTASNLYNKKIELQIRTQLQHIWATTIEIYDITYKSNLKTNIQNTLKTNEELFFKKCSLIFEGIENNHPDIIRKNILDIFQNEELKKIFQKLKTVKHIKNITLPKKLDDNTLFVLITNLTDGKVTFFISPEKENSFINASYRTLEENIGKESILLLLSIKNIRQLKETYPNYFLNTNKFIKILQDYKKIIEKED